MTKQATTNTISTTNWVIRVSAPGFVREDLFEAADYPDTAGEGDTAWVAARDALADDLLGELAEDNQHASLAQSISTLLCDANPEEPVSFSHAGVTITLLPANDDAEDDYTVENFMPDTVLVRGDGTPVATFHVVDEFDEDDEGCGQDEAQAQALATACAEALNAKSHDRTQRPLFSKVRLNAFDSETWQVLVTDANGCESEYALVSAIPTDDDSESVYKAAIINARLRAETLVSAIGKLIH